MEMSSLTATKTKPLSVSDLTQWVKGSLEQFPRMYIVGEISNFKKASSGHWYFSLKDANAQIRCNMWRTATTNVNFRAFDGAQVLVSGTLNVYAPRGEYSLVVDSMEELGLGRLRQAFEQLKTKLAAEGLFDKSLKKPLPLFPRKIGIVTSPTGAALRDILRVLHQRFAGVHVLIFPARVQGDGASAEIALGIKWLDQTGECDLLIVGRGGGSEEDLWAFNEELVARAIFQAKTPIISAVGHEVDFTIADFVADVRAATPSNAAEIAIRSLLEYRQTLQIHARNMERSMQRLLLQLRHRVNISESHPIFVRVRNRLNDAIRRLSEAEHQMIRRVQQKLSSFQMRLLSSSRDLRSEKLSRQLTRYQARLERADTAMATKVSNRVDTQLHLLMTLSHRLEDLSPLKILNRGYAAVYNQKRRLVRSPEDVTFGEILSIRLAEGEIRARVIEAEREIIQGSLF